MKDILPCVKQCLLIPLAHVVVRTDTPHTWLQCAAWPISAHVHWRCTQDVQYMHRGFCTVQYMHRGFCTLVLFICVSNNISCPRLLCNLYAFLLLCICYLQAYFCLDCIIFFDMQPHVAPTPQVSQSMYRENIKMLQYGWIRTNG